jgi:hypothetical protein
MRRFALEIPFTLLAGFALACAADPPPPTEAPAFTMGNGTANWIIIEGATRDGSRFSFPEVQIAGNGWLVMHPFKDGKPVGDLYVGASYLADG